MIHNNNLVSEIIHEIFVLIYIFFVLGKFSAVSCSGCKVGVYENVLKKLTSLDVLLPPKCP